MGGECHKIAATSKMIVLPTHHKRGVQHRAAVVSQDSEHHLKPCSSSIRPSILDIILEKMLVSSGTFIDIHMQWYSSWDTRYALMYVLPVFNGGLKGLSRIYILRKLRNFTVCNGRLCSWWWWTRSWGSGMRATAPWSDDSRLFRLWRWGSVISTGVSLGFESHLNQSCQPLFADCSCTHLERLCHILPFIKGKEKKLR